MTMGSANVKATGDIHKHNLSKKKKKKSKAKTCGAGDIPIREEGNGKETRSTGTLACRLADVVQGGSRQLGSVGIHEEARFPGKTDQLI